MDITTFQKQNNWSLLDNDQKVDRMCKKLDELGKKDVLTRAEITLERDLWDELNFLQLKWSTQGEFVSIH